MQRSIRTPSLAVAAAVTLTACPRDTEPVPPPEAAIAPAGDPGATPHAAQRVTLQPAPGEPVSGEAIALPVGQQTQITLIVHQAPANTQLTGHVMVGNCEEPGPTAADLQPVQVDATGSGSSEVVIDIAPQVVFNGNHLVQLRRQNGRTGLPAACGQIPEAPVLPGER